MAKKKPTKKKVNLKQASGKSNAKSLKATSKKKSDFSAKKKQGKKPVKKTTKKTAKKYVGKKRGRKAGVPNKYNSIKSAISENYKKFVNRKVRRYELKIIYDWIKDTYGDQSVRYIVMNIDVVLDNFWNEYCNAYPVDLENHQLLFDWYHLNEILAEETEYHYPTDIIQVDLTAIGEGVLEFFHDDYLSNVEEYYKICRSKIRRDVSPQPMVELINASCNISKRGNTYRYLLLVDDVSTLESNVNTQKQEITERGGSGVVTGQVAPAVVSPVLPPNAPTIQRPVDVKESSTDVEKERLRLEFALKEAKLRELAQLLKDGFISFKEYQEGVKNV